VELRLFHNNYTILSTVYCISQPYGPIKYSHVLPNDPNRLRSVVSTRGDSGRGDLGGGGRGGPSERRESRLSERSKVPPSAR